MKRSILMFCLLLLLLLVKISFAQTIIKSVDFIDASVLDIVNSLAKQAGIDIITSGDSSSLQEKRSTLHLKNISAEEAIDHVLANNGITYEKKGKTLLVSFTPDQSEVKGIVKTVYLKYLSADKVAELLAKVLPSLKTTAGGATNAIIIQGRGSLVAEAQKVLESIDKPVAQVLIESKVVEISASDSMRLGISYGNPAGTFRFITDKTTKRTSLAEDIQETVNVLVGNGKAKIIASPRIATLDNHEAIINIGSRIPYAVPVTSNGSSNQWTVEYIDAGVKLKITPIIGNNGYITASLQPEVSNISEWKTTSAGEFPVISTRNASATLRIKDGETIVIGGLLSENDRETISRVPILGYIPVLGLFFQNKISEKEKTEIVFLITTHII